MKVFSSPFPPSLSKGVVSQGWQADPATRMVMPKKPGRWQYCSFNLYPSSACCSVAQMFFFLVLDPLPCYFSSSFLLNTHKNIYSRDLWAIFNISGRWMTFLFSQNRLTFFDMLYLPSLVSIFPKRHHPLFFLCYFILSSPESHALIHLVGETYWFMLTVKRGRLRSDSL